MAKKEEVIKGDETVNDDKTEVVNQPAGAPIAPDVLNTTPSLATLSHQWQENSPALNTNVLAGYGSQQNFVADAKAAEELAKQDKKEEVKKPLSEAEYERRTKLDVSDPNYVNPSLDHVEVK